MGPLDCGSFFCALGFDPRGAPPTSCGLTRLQPAGIIAVNKKRKHREPGNRATKTTMDNLQNYGLTGYTQLRGFDAIELNLSSAPFASVTHHQLCVGTLCRFGRHQSRARKLGSRPVNSIKFKSLRDRATSGHESAMALTRNQSPMYDERTFEYASIPNRN